MKKIAHTLFLCLLVFSNFVHAQTPAATAFAFERFMVVAKGSGWTTGANAAGQTVAMGPAVLTKAYATAGAATVTPLAAGGATVGLTVGSAAAGSVLATSEAVATGAAVFGLFKTLMGGPVGIGLTALMASPAIIEWLADGQVRAGTGSLPFDRADPSVCSAGPCYEYGDPHPAIGWGPSPMGACAASASLNFPGMAPEWYPGAGVPNHSTGEVNCFAIFTGYGFYPLTVSIRSVSPSSANWQPATIEQIRVEMESIPVKKAVIDALLQAAQDGPEPKPSLPLTSPKKPTVLPSSVSDSSVVTTTKVDGK